MKILLCLQFNNKSAWGGRSFPQPRNVPAKNSPFSTCPETPLLSAASQLCILSASPSWLQGKAEKSGAWCTPYSPGPWGEEGEKQHLQFPKWLFRPAFILGQMQKKKLLIYSAFSLLPCPFKSDMRITQQNLVTFPGNTWKRDHVK